MKEPKSCLDLDFFVLKFKNFLGANLVSLKFIF